MSLFEKGKAGRPPGASSERTLARAAAKRRFIDRVIIDADRLFNAQLDKAIGEKFLIVKITERGSRGGIIREYHEVVTDTQTIIEYLDGELKGGEPIGDADHYYYMSTKPADNLAIANMLDRAFGKPTEKVQIGDDEDEKALNKLSDDELNKRIAEHAARRSGS